jgi:quercetin dioxygenase-like cupin family protein
MAAPELKPGLNLGMRNASRYICSHDASGKGIFLDSPELQYFDAGGAYCSARSYALSKVPAPLANDVDVKEYLDEDGEKYITSHRNNAITIDGGVNIVCVNFAPGKQTAMHRTTSIDFAIIVEGEVEIELDGGDKKQLAHGVSCASSNIMLTLFCIVEKCLKLFRIPSSSERQCIDGEICPTPNQRD